MRSVRCEIKSVRYRDCCNNPVSLDVSCIEIILYSRNAYDITWTWNILWWDWTHWVCLAVETNSGFFHIIIAENLSFLDLDLSECISRCQRLKAEHLMKLNLISLTGSENSTIFRFHEKDRQQPQQQQQLIVNMKPHYWIYAINNNHSKLFEICKKNGRQCRFVELKFPN